MWWSGLSPCRGVQRTLKMVTRLETCKKVREESEEVQVEREVFIGSLRGQNIHQDTTGCVWRQRKRRCPQLPVTRVAHWLHST